jgi:hypothetical protein
MGRKSARREEEESDKEEEDSEKEERGEGKRWSVLILRAKTEQSSVSVMYPKRLYTKSS